MADAARVNLEECRPLIEAALAKTDGVWTWDDVEREVEAGRAFLMVSPSGNSVAVLQPVRDLHVFTASGDMAELMALEAEASERAGKAGFDRMTLIGRAGWSRALKARGWKPESGLVKEL